MLIGVDARELEGKPHGVGRVVSNILRQWAIDGRGHRFILYFRNQIPGLDFLRQPHFETKLTRAPGPLDRGRIWEQAVLPLQIKKDRVDVLLSPCYTIPLFADCPAVVMIYDISFQTRPETYPFLNGMLWRWLARWSVRLARKVIVCSDFTADEILSNYGQRHKHKLSRAYLGIEEKFKPDHNEESKNRLASRFGIAAPFFLFVGTLFERRNVPLIVRAFRKLTLKHPDCLLVVVGSNTREFGGETARLKNLLRKCQIEDKVRRFDYLPEDDLQAFLRSAVGLVYPSTYEGFGLPMVEAMASGTPAIISSAPTLTEVSDGAAYVADPLTEDALCSAMTALLEDPKVRDEFVRKGLERAQKLDWGQTASAVLSAIEEVSAIKP
ncbi:MAG: glycosyltransferase family 4 protein [Nitrospinae bacterium]|nr:glycosyltransferase family 4 protein [Nitrospinota bacterium]